MTTDIRDQGSTEPRTARAEDDLHRRPRAALIVNPYSSGITSARERAIVRGLREHMDLEVRRTERGGHAPKIARELVDNGNLDVLIACGGDGTGNEVLNGMDLADATAETRPAFAVLPAGGTNVLARSIGMPNHPVRAISQLAEAIVARRTRTINLGTVDERVWMFASGIGIDAEMIRHADEHRKGRRPSDISHIVAGIGTFARSRWALKERMSLRVDGGDEELRAAMLLVGNTTPLTYLGKIGVHMMPECMLDKGLDFVAPDRANLAFTARFGAQSLGMGRTKSRLASEQRMRLHHDVRSIVVTCDEPEPVQADGEYLGERTHITYGLLEHAVRLVI